MISLDYIAGFVDGEGCITLTKRIKRRKNGRDYVEYQPVMVVSNTNKQILEEIKRQISGSIVTHNTKALHKKSYALRLANRQCYKAMNALKDYLIVKKPQALLILKFKEIIDSLEYGDLQNKSTIEKLDKLINEFRKLNRRGAENKTAQKL